MLHDPAASAFVLLYAGTLAAAMGTGPDSGRPSEVLLWRVGPAVAGAAGAAWQAGWLARQPPYGSLP